MVSTPTLRSVAPSRSSGNVGMAIERRVLVFTSDWHFKPAGVDLLHAQLQSLLADPHVPILFQWEEESASFIVQCIAGNTDAVAAAFLHVHQGIIDKECTRDNSDSDAESESGSDDGSVSSDSSQGWGGRRAIVSDKIMLLSEWKQKKLLEAPPGESTPSRQPQLDPSPAPLAPSQQPSRTYHIFLSEGVADFQVVLRNVLDVRKRYFETTLLDNQLTTSYDYVYMYNSYAPGNKALAEAITARCTLPDYKRNLYFAVKESKCKSVTKEEDTTLPSRDWVGFIYQKQGSNDPLLRTKTSKPNKSDVPITPQPQKPLSQSPQVQAPVVKQASAIDEWARELPAAQNTYESFALPEKRAMWDDYQPYGEDVKPVVPKVEGKILPNRRNVSASAAALPSQKTATSPQQQAAILPHLRQTSLQQRSPNQVPPSSTSTPVSRLTPPHLRVIKPPSQPPQAQRMSRNLLDDSSVIDYPSLMDSTPVMVPSTYVSVSDDLITFDDQPGDFVRQSYGEELHDMFGSIQEVQQQDDEVLTRLFRSTMNQKAPKPQGRQDKSSSFADRLPLPSPPRQKSKASSSKQVRLPELASAGPDFIDILRTEKASTFQGQIRVQADFGRILLRNIPKQFVTKKDSDKSYKRDYLSESVMQQHSVQSTFTKVLTSVPQDVHFLVDMDDDGSRMWEAKPFTWSVVYEFRCTSSARHFTVEMDGETMECSVSTETNFGDIYVHGIKRHWDVRLGVSGRTDVSEHHIEFVNAIKGSLFIPADAKYPDLRFELPDLTPGYSVDAIRVHRITKFRNIQPQNGSVLNVREIQDLTLKFKKIAVADSNITIFKAFLEPGVQNLNPLEKLDMWYEVSITSPEIDEKLKNEATWTLEEIRGLNGADQVLQPACLMLQKMDGVGSYNFNGVTGARPAREPSPPPPEPEQFW